MRSFLTLALLFCVLSGSCDAQVIVLRDGRRIRNQFRIESVDVNATVRDQAASVQMAQVFENLSSRTIQAEFLFPLPEGAAISELTLVVDGKELTGELKKREDARRIYESIVRRRQDPALLEYVGNGVFKTSVFPIPPRQKRRVEIRYTQLLKKDSGLVDFTLPLGTIRHSNCPVAGTNVSVRISTTEAIKTIYSPTHSFKIDRPDDHRAKCSLSLPSVSRPADVRLMFGTKRGDVGMSLVSYRPDADKDGYFLLLASPRVKSKKSKVLPKTVVFVVDRSGSMAGSKIDQAKASLKYMINQLGDKDTFNIVAYSSDVTTFRPELELVNAETKQAALAFVEDIFSGGGTNIDGALRASLSMLKDANRPNYVLFLTDGLPTVGQQDERKIAAGAKAANEVKARVFSFGVGYDVNSRLLDRLSRDHRGSSVYVKPTEDIEVAATQVFRKVSSPVMTRVAVDIVPTTHDSHHKPVRRMYPQQLTDLFRGEQLVLVGRYRTGGKTQVTMTGEINGKQKTFRLNAELAAPSSDSTHNYVERLWATRRIGELIDQLDLNGQNKELVDELVRLSLKHGIMTPYTAFLAEEETELAANGSNTRRARRLLEGLSQTSGRRGFAQRDFKKRLQAGAGVADAEKAAESFRASNSSAAPSAGGGGAGGGRGRFGGTPARTPGKHDKKDQSKSESKSGQDRIRRIGTKTFYWRKNVWRDSAIPTGYDYLTDKDKKVITIEQFSREYFDLAAKDKGKWSRFLSLREPVLVSLGGKVYRVTPPKTKAK